MPEEASENGWATEDLDLVKKFIDLSLLPGFALGVGVQATVEIFNRSNPEFFESAFQSSAAVGWGTLLVANAFFYAFVKSEVKRTFAAAVLTAGCATASVVSKLSMEEAFDYLKDNQTVTQNYEYSEIPQLVAQIN